MDASQRDAVLAALDPEARALLDCIMSGATPDRPIKRDDAHMTRLHGTAVDAGRVDQLDHVLLLISLLRDYVVAINLSL